MINNFKKWLIRFTENTTVQSIYYKSSIIVSILLVLSILRVQVVDPNYASLLNTLVKLYVGVFLFIRFNPLIKDTPKKKQKFFDNTVAFAGGFYLIFEAITLNVISYYKKNI